MKTLINPFRGVGMSHPDLTDMPWPASDATTTQTLLARCPHAAVTPLVAVPELAAQAGIHALYIKDERTRMGLGSFKALGAAYVIVRDAEAGKAEGQTYVTASAGNHGLSVAAGAAAFGARSRIYLAGSVPESFADRLRGIGADVVRAGDVYEESMTAAAKAAKDEGLILLSDSSWPGYSARPYVLMEGYLALMAEAVDAMTETPTHIVLQAGVGGLAAACAAHARAAWGAAPQIIVVEPEAAPALIESIKAGAPVVTQGPVSAMGRLDCKEPSLIALKGLARDADVFVTISEEEGASGAQRAASAGFASTPSGAAGISAVLAGGLDLGPKATVLAILSEEETA